MNDDFRKFVVSKNRRGIALIITMIVLVLLTTILYQLGSDLSQWKHRQQYIIDYQKARYGCESGLKYAMSAIEDVNAVYVDRSGEPDFSDLFITGDAEYKAMMAEWALDLGSRSGANDINVNDYLDVFISLTGLSKLGDSNDPNDVNDANMFELADVNDMFASENEIDPAKLFVRGPYGPAWPYIIKPAEFEFGDSKVRVEIMDENAKLPLSWGISGDKDVSAACAAAVESFCEWMQIEPGEIKILQEELDSIAEVKQFSTELKPIVSIEEVETKVTSKAPRRLLARRRNRTRTRTVIKKQKVTRPAIGHTRDFAKMLHSPMLDIERLDVAINEDENRSESALKYIGLWGTQRVNINSAPRHVLESAFMFGGKSVRIADEIIAQRVAEPFKDIEDLQERLYGYNDSIEKSAPYICTESSYFTIRATAVSGTAKLTAVVGIKKEGDKFEKIGFFME